MFANSFITSHLISASLGLLFLQEEKKNIIRAVRRYFSIGIDVQSIVMMDCSRKTFTFPEIKTIIHMTIPYVTLVECIFYTKSESI